MLSGTLAALWLLGLLAAAPALRTGSRYAFADRLRDALILGAAIPFALGLIGLLYPAACWIVLAICVAIAYRRAPPRAAIETPRGRPPYVLIAALAVVAWPALMRPPLDGDTLSYHLPNAAAWVHAHGLWTTDPRYWWYPPGSEIFAAGLFAVSGPFAVGWSGFGALALLGFRVAHWANAEFGAPEWLADALAAATVTMTPLALQAGSLQNDVWLAAFFLESFWVLGRETAAAARTVAIVALLKPYGWIFAFVDGGGVARAAERLARSRGGDRRLGGARCAALARVDRRAGKLVVGEHVGVDDPRARPSGVCVARTRQRPSRRRSCFRRCSPRSSGRCLRAAARVASAGAHSPRLRYSS